MQSSDLHPWPHDDLTRKDAIGALIRVGLAEVVLTDDGRHYRLLPSRTDRFTSQIDPVPDPAERA